jgi:hypothetical protein
MFERFTGRARRVLVLAQEEGRLLDHNFISTEHILLGLLGGQAVSLDVTRAETSLLIVGSYSGELLLLGLLLGVVAHFL